MSSGSIAQSVSKADPHLSHISDSIGYYVAKEFPIVSREIVESRFVV